jgi:hypothetical protein
MLAFAYSSVYSAVHVHQKAEEQEHCKTITSAVVLSVHVHNVTISTSDVHSAYIITVRCTVSAQQTQSLSQLMVLRCYYQYRCTLLLCGILHCDSDAHVSTAADAADTAAAAASS